MKRLILAVVMLFATVAEATPHTFTGTIDTPPVTVWVNGNGDTVAPFTSFQTSPLYVDAVTAFVWTVRNIENTACVSTTIRA